MYFEGKRVFCFGGVCRTVGRLLCREGDNIFQSQVVGTLLNPGGLPLGSLICSRTKAFDGREAAVKNSRRNLAYLEGAPPFGKADDLL